MVFEIIEEKWMCKEMMNDLKKEEIKDEKRVAIIGSDLSQELFDKNKQKSEEDFEIVLYRKIYLLFP